MNLNSYFKSCSIILLGIVNLLIPADYAYGQEEVISLNSDNTAINWQVKSEEEVAGNNAIHEIGFDATGWVKATVPGTVFGSYVEQGLEDDPNYGDNIYKVDKTKYDRNFWYRTEFSVPSSYNSSTVWLNLEGVNRDAEVYVNGNLLGRLEGIMERGKFDITNIVNGNDPNSLVLLVYVPMPPMNISAMPSYVASASWDWMPYVPGLNMGITDDVYLSKSRAVTIEDPWIRTEVPNASSANLTITTTLSNHTNATVSGVLTGTINPGNIQFTENVSLAANETKSVSSYLNIVNPKLWWPNGYGDPNLYVCKFEFVTSVLSDSKEVTFGIREYSYDIEGGVLHVSINGKRIFLKGGNWGMSEYMLRCRGEEYDTKLRLHKEMNFNMVRNWVGSTTDAEFYEACDKYGIMIWDDFWMITTYFNWPRSKEIFERNVIEKIKRYRNHPSIAVWCGANEMTPPADWDIIYTNAVSEYDGNDRHYQPNSREGGLSGSGPWEVKNPDSYYDNAYAMFIENQNFGLRTELGVPVFTTFESFKEFMPEENWWPRNSMWDKHFFGDTYAPAAGPDGYMDMVNNRYGVSSGIEQFCTKAQLLNIESNKAMFEGWLHNMGNDASGLLIWMSQSAYPSLVWQTYDYYHDLTGAYWGAKKACEPLHILMHPSTGNVEVANTSGMDYSNLTAKIAVYNADGSATSLEATVPLNDISQNVIKKIHNIDFSSASLSSVYFVRLELKDEQGKLLSENFYWRGTTEGNFTALNSLPVVVPEVIKDISVEGDKTIVEATITNPASSPAVAFATRVQLVKPGSGERVLPVFMDDNYFTLLPAESRIVRMEVETKQLKGENPEVLVKPYNSGDNAYTGPNLALYKPVTVSSTEGDHKGSLAVDGNLTGTRWGSEYSDPQWLYVDLGDTYNIDSINITWEGAYGKDYEIQLSANATDWSTIKTIEDNATLVNKFKHLNGSGRYVRIYGTARGSQWGYSIYELEVYGNQRKGEASMGITDLGGTITAQYNNSLVEEDVENLIDNNFNTKFVTPHSTAWVQFAANDNYVVDRYELVSANDSPKYDPRNWTLEGSEDGINWFELDSRTEEEFSERFQIRSFSFNNSVAYNYYRFNFSNKTGNMLQLTEIELFGELGDDNVLGIGDQLEKGDDRYPYPIPFSQEIYIPIEMKTSGRVTVAIYDFTGKKIAIIEKEFQTGSHIIAWNDLNGQGSMNNSGMYLLKIETAYGVQVYKIVKE